MEGEVIERTYRHKIPTPKELFESFRVEFCKRTLPDSWTASTPWTHLILGIFDGIGRSFGYVPRREYLRLDQTWEIRHSDISLIALALEYENTYDLNDIINDELQKLLDVKAFLKVLVFCPTVSVLMDQDMFIYPEVQEKIRSAKIKHPHERYIIMSLVNARGEAALEVSGCTFDPEGKGEDLGAFQVAFTSKD